jgi:hypothetical protein
MLLFMKLQFILKLSCERFGMRGCEAKTLANLFFGSSGVSWTDGNSGGRKTMIFSNRAAIWKPGGGTRLSFGDGHEVVLIEQWIIEASVRSSPKSSLRRDPIFSYYVPRSFSEMTRSISLNRNLSLPPPPTTLDIGGDTCPPHLQQ